MGMMEYVEEWVIDMRVRELSEGSIAVNRTLIQYYLNYSNFKTQGKVWNFTKRKRTCESVPRSFLFHFLIILHLNFGRFSNFDGCQIFIGGGGVKEKPPTRGGEKYYFSILLYSFESL